MSNKPKLNTQEAAAYLGVRPNTLEVWRCKHRGPKYAKLGSRIVYDPEELDAFFTASSVNTRDTELMSRRRSAFPSQSEEARV
jgi:transposase-like protein